MVLSLHTGGGTGAVPAIAQLAKEREIPHQVPVTLPFLFEGKVCPASEQAKIGTENRQTGRLPLIVINTIKRSIRKSWF
jgi:cell division protein FtsZ